MPNEELYLAARLRSEPVGFSAWQDNDHADIIAATMFDRLEKKKGILLLRPNHLLQADAGYARLSMALTV